MIQQICPLTKEDDEWPEESDDDRDLPEKEISIEEALEYNERKKTGEGIL